MAPLDAQNDPFEALPIVKESKLKDVREFMAAFEASAGKYVGLGGEDFRQRAQIKGVRRKVLKKFDRTTVEGARRMNKLAVSSPQQIRRATKLSCFSQKWDSLLMWSHYGNGHNGVCLEYSTDPSKMTGGRPAVLSVRYRKERPSIHTLDLMEFVASSSLEHSQLDFIDLHNVQVTFEKAVMTKSDVWSYEDEWRAIMYDDDPAGYRYAPGLNVERILIGVGVDASFERRIKQRYGDLVPINRLRLGESRFCLEQSL